MIATCSGQRKFRLPCQESDSEEEEKEEEEDMIIDNTLKTWRVNGQYEWFSYDTTMVAEEPQQTAAWNPPLYLPTMYIYYTTL